VIGPLIVLRIEIESPPQARIVAMRAPDACRAGAWAASQREQAHQVLDEAIDAAQNECEAWPSGACSCRLRTAA
jgi:hypothetical protein